MRTAAFIGRFRLNCGGSQLLRFAPRSQFRFPRPQYWNQRNGWRRVGSRTRVVGTVLLGALTPATFLELAEKGNGGGEKTRELKMLEASRSEIEKTVDDDARGLSRVLQKLQILYCKYIYEPIATGLRFFHLVIIFIPVIVTVPAIWFGRRVKSRGGERTGTLWWYGFLVSSMERAGPAFIKVSSCSPAIAEYRMGSNGGN